MDYVTLEQLIKQRLRLQYGVDISDKAVKAIMDEVFDWLTCAKVACVRPVEPIDKNGEGS